MEKVRKPFQGVLNIVRFNWHFYVLSIGFVLLLVLLAAWLPVIATFCYIVGVLALLVNVVSLLVSCYVYDVSGLYRFNWIHPTGNENCIVNIHAGFDETSQLLSSRFNGPLLEVLDFYDPAKHTEISIRRARKAYPAYPGTREVTTAQLPLADNSADKIFLILAAHEIRNEAERIAFFQELRRILKPAGELFITEHLRDTANFLAYSIGAFHFHSRATWLRTFNGAQLVIEQERKLTPFISTFILKKTWTSILKS